ncbi:lipid asymmetry maintenance ABC transporter permease subunit MlaE [Dyella marensis]|jgi:phospholipid/cholesterol/gamma-HCH transport system permease protein|uniref:Intermembrane phospholipid transport system permease protein MlaE n=1 Tax=Dyella marensis TaxID=500610 RepID=A0A1I2GYL9_9GAMM|nr:MULTISPECIES: lipid asymmetry maintenance ABC transporter permease subunit MlaE [Dyella]SFF22855.1 phospholipid/cholesterol/gamma-HCH transport system permease protein [Dyella marensis]
MNAPRDNIVTRSLAQIGDCGLFLLQILAAVPRSMRHARETVRQLWFVGAMSLIIIMVCGLFVGMVLGLQLYDVLSIFGGTSATGTVVAIAIYRELGPVVTALLFAGRAGTSVTAEIGLMRATDQIAAMEMMAVDPIAYVAVPRFLAGIIAMPLLCCVFCALGIFGGHLVGVSWLGIDNGTFWSNMTATVDLVKDVLNGVLWKSMAFGGVVSLIAVFQGYTTPPTSEGVAYATTRTVVASSIAILALDFVLTAFLM